MKKIVASIAEQNLEHAVANMSIVGWGQTVSVPKQGAKNVIGTAEEQDNDQ
tara:strand:- start:803 stop:955 length:153 start_codon:yes stop_codon:yes gene_type:complete